MLNDRIYFLTHKRVRTEAAQMHSLELRHYSIGGTEEYHKISRTISEAKYAIGVLFYAQDGW